jgi:hypothetical protein
MAILWGVLFCVARIRNVLLVDVTVELPVPGYCLIHLRSFSTQLIHITMTYRGYSTPIRAMTVFGIAS